MDTITGHPGQGRETHHLPKRLKRLDGATASEAEEARLDHHRL